MSVYPADCWRLQASRSCIHNTLMLTLAMLLIFCSMACAEWKWVEEDTEQPFAYAGTITITDPQLLNLQLIACGETQAPDTDALLVDITGKQVSISRRLSGNTETLASATLPLPLTGSKLDFTLHRTAWTVTLILNHRVTLKAWDSLILGAANGCEIKAGATVDDTWLQALGEIDAADTFEREAGAQDEWAALTGKWQHISLREDNLADKMQADKSANAFSYSGSAPQDFGLSAFGAWFWRDCRYSLRVKGLTATPAVGLAFYVRDEKNFMLLRWDNQSINSDTGPNLQLIQIIDGQRTVIAQRPGGFQPEQWYALRVDAAEDTFRCFLDDEFIFSASANSTGQGRIGAYVEGAKGASFDDVSITNYVGFSDDFTSDAPLRWQVGDDVSWTLNKLAKPVKNNTDQFLFTGNPQWSSYQMQTQVNTSSGAGLAVCVNLPDSYYLFRWATYAATSPWAGHAQLVRVTGGEFEVLADAPLPADPPRLVTAKVIAEADYLAGYINGVRVVDVALPELIQGGIGLYAPAGSDVQFSSVLLEPLPQRHMARVTKEFTDTKEHYEMADWASTRHAWVKPDEKANPQVWWSKGDFHEPYEIRMPLRKLGQADGELRLALAGDPDAPESSIILIITAHKDSKQLTFALKQGETELATAAVEIAAPECVLSVALRGKTVMICVDDNPVLTTKIS